MLRKVFILVATVLTVGICDLQAAQISSTWDGGGDGYFWKDANNWNPDIVPDNNATNTFAVTIDSGGAIANVRLQQGWTIDQLDCYGEVELDSWTVVGWAYLTLADASGLTNHGDLEILEFNVLGNITNTAGTNLLLADVDTKGNLCNLSGGTMDFEREIEADGNVENAGSMIVMPGGTLLVENMGNTFHNTGQLQLLNAFCTVEDLFHNDSTGVVTGLGGILASETSIQNNGEIYAYGGSLAIKCDGPLTNTGTLGNMCLSTLYINPAEDVNNQGNIIIKPGGGVAFNCNLANEPNATIQLNGGTLALNNSTITQQAGATFEGFGTISGGSGGIVIEPDAEIKLTASTNIVGNLDINEDATLEISDGVTLVTGQTVCDGTIYMKGGYIVPQGGLSGECNIIWEPGLYTNASDFNLDGQVNFEDFAYMADTWLWQTACR